MRRSWSRSTEPDGALLALRILAFAAAAPGLLRRRRLSDLAAALEPERPPAGGPTAAQVAARLAQVDRVIAAAWPLVRRGCLTRGLTRYRFLRELGADVSLAFGVAPERGDWAGHCWLELGGEPLAEPRDPRPTFAETWRIPPPPANPATSAAGVPPTPAIRAAPSAAGEPATPR